MVSRLVKLIIVYMVIVEDKIFLQAPVSELWKNTIFWN
jgi:hypothetical protein